MDSDTRFLGAGCFGFDRATLNWRICDRFLPVKVVPSGGVGGKKASSADREREHSRAKIYMNKYKRIIFALI